MLCAIKQLQERRAYSVTRDLLRRSCNATRHHKFIAVSKGDFLMVEHLPSEGVLGANDAYQDLMIAMKIAVKIGPRLVPRR